MGKAEIAQRIKSARINAGFTQKEVAERLDLTPQAISNFERGKNGISNDILRSLCELYNISADIIIENAAVENATVLSIEKNGEIAERIKNRRREIGLSLQEVADLTSMHRSTLHRYEMGGIKNIPLYQLENLARALKTSPDWLLGWDEEPEDHTIIDTDFRHLLRDLGYPMSLHGPVRYVDTWEMGPVPLSEKEYEQLRENVMVYITMSLDFLLKSAHTREQIRIKEDLARMRVLGEQMEQGTSLDEAFTEAMNNQEKTE